MNSSGTSIVTTELLWAGTLLLLFIDCALFPLAVALVPRPRFAAMRLSVTICSGFFWACLWATVVAIYWDDVYGYFFPAWSRVLIPIAFGLFYAIAASLLWRLAMALRVNPVLSFVLGGATIGPLTHVWAVSRGLVERAPMLNGASPLAAVVISFPEFACYWIVILLAAALAQRFRDRAGRWLRQDSA